MRTSVVHTTVCALALLSAAIGQAQTGPTQTAPANTPPAATPKPSREASVPTTPVRATPPSQSGFISEDLWRDEGATAQCRDGTYFHGYATARTCSDHGGLLRWLRGPDHPTLR
jgi:Protein of unknown function (DUF3761)